MSRYATLLNSPTPQTSPMDKRQVKNNAGGFVFELDIWARLDRFLVLGSDAPTYYQEAKDLTKANAASVMECWKADAGRTADRIAEISDEGRAPKNDPAIFALALGATSGDLTILANAYRVLPKVCRISTHLFQFVDAYMNLGRKGAGRALKRAIANWYSSKDTDALAYQAIKYRSREGFTHKRTIELAHRGAGEDSTRKALHLWVRGKEVETNWLPQLIQAHLKAMKTTDKAELIDLIKDHRLPWEAIPTEAKRDPDVWNAMVPHLGLTALIRNLGNMTEIGAIGPMKTSHVVERLNDADQLRKSRVHPFAVLQALAVYKSGKGVQGGKTWRPEAKIIDALDKAFYGAFKNVTPTGKRILLGLDVSGSMGTSFIGGVLNAREASAAMAMVTMAVEQNVVVGGFTAAGRSPMITEARRGRSWGYGDDAFSLLDISARQRLDDVVAKVTGLPFGNTDCSLPMLYALQNKIPVDAFVVFTDNETYAGGIHPIEALRQYRSKMGIKAKLIVVGMTSTGFSIADPKDGGCLDVVGFDASAPAVMSEFIRA